MIPWRLIIIGLVVLFVAVIGLSNFGGVSDNIKSWLKNTPLSGFVSTPDAGAKTIDIKVYLESFKTKADAPVKISSERANLVGFDGTLMMDFVQNSLNLIDSKSGLEINVSLAGSEISEFRLNKLVLSDVKFELNNGKLKTSSDNGTVELYGFSGSLKADADGIRLVGNVSNYLTPPDY